MAKFLVTCSFNLLKGLVLCVPVFATPEHLRDHAVGVCVRVTSAKRSSPCRACRCCEAPGGLPAPPAGAANSITRELLPASGAWELCALCPPSSGRNCSSCCETQPFTSFFSILQELQTDALFRHSSFSFPLFCTSSSPSLFTYR